MIAKALVFVCAAFGLVAGSCFEICPQQCSQPAPQVVTLPEVSLPTSVLESLLSSSSSSSCSGSNGETSYVEVAAASGPSCCLQPGNGPETSVSPVIQAPAVTLPAVEGPTVTLSSQPIPAPRVLAQRCICTKTIVKPQVYQRTVTVPRIQRYLKRTVTPVVENVSYKSTPISQESGSSAVYVSSGSGSGSSCSGSQARIVISSSSCPKLC